MSYSSLGEIEALVRDGVAESLTLEFKAAAALARTSESRKELVKDVTAMANSAGGVIVYGIREANGCAASVDLPGVDTSIISPEWIGQIIGSNTSPRIQGVLVKAIDTGVDAGFAIYVVTVPQATSLAPHQSSFDQKYYKRFDQRSVPMHDYEIRDVLRRGYAPNIDVRLSFPGGSLQVDLPDDSILPLIVEIENLSYEPSLYTHLEINFEKGIQIQSSGQWNLEAYDRKTAGITTRQINLKIMVPQDFPIVRGSNITVGPPEILVRAPAMPEKPFLIIANVLSPGCAQSHVYSITRTSDDMVVLERATLESSGGQTAS